MWGLTRLVLFEDICALVGLNGAGAGSINSLVNQLLVQELDCSVLELNRLHMLKLSVQLLDSVRKLDRLRYELKLDTLVNYSVRELDQLVQF